MCVLSIQARVKKTMKCDPSVKNVQKEALSIVAKSTELFIAYLAKRGAEAATQRGVRTIKDADIIRAIHADEALSFLSEDFPVALLKAKSSKRALEAPLGGEGSEEKDVKSRKVTDGGSAGDSKSSLLNYFGTFNRK